MSKKLIIFAIITLAGAALILNAQGSKKSSPPTSQKATAPTIQTDTPQLVATKPDPLDEAIIVPGQTVELTFNLAIENIGEFKHRLEPLTTKYQAKLSDDRKSVIITPSSGAFPVGTTFTLFVSPETKFDGGKRMNNELIIHFKTVDFRGV